MFFKFLFIPMLTLFAVFAVSAQACSMGGDVRHNMAHDGTPNCASCTCAHHRPEPPAAEEAAKHDHTGAAGHRHADVPGPLLRRLLADPAGGVVLAACRTYKVICGQDCTNRRVNNGGVWITVRDCRPRYCDHTTCN